MINFLRKLFIKDYQNVEDEKVRTKHGFLASFVGLFSNLLLFVFKLLIGLITSSMSIITDALNNMSDMASCLLNVFGFKMSSKPADKKHPFGHQRIEYIIGLIISLIIIAVAVLLGYSSIMKIISNEATSFNYIVFIILGASIVIKLLQGLFYLKMSKIINSTSLKASSQDSISDVISTSAVLIAIIVEFIFPNIHLDGYMGVVVALFIAVNGIKMVVESSSPLIGDAPDKALVEKISNEILSYEGVLGIHDVMCHLYGPTKMFMSVHVEVDARVDVMISHDLIDNIEREIREKYHSEITIHMDPIIVDNEEINMLKEKTNEMLIKYNSVLKFHDFRIVSGPTHTNVLFDIVIPFETKIKEEELLLYLKNEYSKIDTKYNLVINIDKDYIG
ncbi:MAG: cation diffusion facilitator family transporter [Bacilli bacterium]